MLASAVVRRIGLLGLALAPLLALIGMSGQAAAYSPGCGSIPIVGGIPPWGFHTGSPGEGGGYARGHGEINLEANTVPGNIMKIIVRVVASNDPKCEVGTAGRATLFASYNGVRSDSVQFFFPAACRDQDHLYHGTQVNNQVPPL
jgi:hypothetical protein